MGSALTQRVLTSLALAPLIAAAVLFLSTPFVAAFLALVVLLAAWEWCTLAGVERVSARALYLALLGCTLLVLWLVPERAWLKWLSLIVAVLWWVVALLLYRIRRIASASMEHVDFALLPLGVFVLVAPWAALVYLHAQGNLGPSLVLFLLVLVWAADSAAYFVGRRFGPGRAKLAPILSPGKTRVGVYGGVAAAGVCGLLLGIGIELDWPEILSLIGICALTAIISVVGDLFESLLKRRRGIKDSGRLLPGHGGMLDRIDSLTSAAPVFTVGILWLLQLG